MHKGVGKARLEVSSVSDSSLFSYCDLRDVFTLMVIGYTFRGRNSFIFIFTSHLIGGQHLKKRICSPRVDPVLKGLHCPGKQIGSEKKLSPFENWWTFYGSVPIHHQVSGYTPCYKGEQLS